MLLWIQQTCSEWNTSILHSIYCTQTTICTACIHTAYSKLYTVHYCFTCSHLCRFSAIRSRSQTSVERELRSTCIPCSWRAVRAWSGPKTLTRRRMMFSGLTRMLKSLELFDRSEEPSVVPLLLVSSEQDPLVLLGRVIVGVASSTELICCASWSSKTHSSKDWGTIPAEREREIF